LWDFVLGPIQSDSHKMADIPAGASWTAKDPGLHPMTNLMPPLYN